MKDVSTMTEPKTLQEAIVYFSDTQRCFDYAVKLRWPDGKVTCPRCDGEKHSFIKTRRIWFCYDCQMQFTLKVGTIFEDSPIGMDKWMSAFWMLANCKNGISSMEIHRALGVTQKTAWFMLQRIRKAMQTKDYIRKMSGHVEVDETFIGGKARNMHKSVKARRIAGQGHNVDDKVVVWGALERGEHGSTVRAQVIPDRKRDTLHPLVKDNVTPGTSLYSDELWGYTGLERDYDHQVIDHAVEYVKGDIHTNGMENFWSLLKRGLHGTYVSVEPFHLHRYISEQMFRFNNRATKNRPFNDADRFRLAMSHVFGKRLTYQELTGKVGKPHEPDTSVPF